MNVMQTIVSFMGCIENKFEIINTAETLQNHSKRLLSVLTPALLYWYQFSHKGIRLSLKSPEKRISSTFGSSPGVILIQTGFKLWKPL